ncbi:MAG: GSCFA domain-containing protein [Paludibacteraceae bacterium]|nr:GSCFA domain-containing protein [Paludibacteraceae bacterium]
MIFTTPVTIPQSSWSIDYHQRLLLLGSCFSDHIAACLRSYFFQVTANPTGALYNPLSIAHHADRIEKADVVIVTFGTAWVYIDKKEGTGLEHVVDNCQKRPASDFVRYRLTVDDIVSTWQPILQKHTDKRFIFTVSPIRHIKDGLHENQLSKGILLQAIDRLLSADDTFRDRVQYFPSYEIVLDELRDYRFYAADMLHPSDVAVEYIFSRFVQTYLYEPHTQADMRTLHQLYQDFHHRPLHPESIEYQQFRQGIIQRAEQLRVRFPWLPDALF